MILFLLTLLLIGLAMSAMSLGLLLGRPPIKGSCGGLGGCAACGGEGKHCRRSGNGKELPERTSPLIENTSNR